MELDFWPVFVCMKLRHNYLMAKSTPKEIAESTTGGGSSVRGGIEAGLSVVGSPGGSVMTSHTYSPTQLIKDAAKHGELVVFVGAGASKLCGSPDWRGFANQVVDMIERAKELTFLEAEQLRAMGDSRRTLSIAMDIAQEKGVFIDFDGILHPRAADVPGLELYGLLAELRPVFVTTNYDKWLDMEFPEVAKAESTPLDGAEPTKGPATRTTYFRREHLTSEKLAERGAVIHLHGSYLEQSSMVVSLRDYIEHYADERVKTFLNHMFRNYTVLFVGYGLGELEILEHIVRSNEAASGGDEKEPRHFILYAHRSSEAVQSSFIERFFRRQCGVKVIPYCIDAAGFGELVSVFKSWSSQLDVRDPTLLDLQRHIDRCIVDGAIPSERSSAIRSVLKRPELTAYFMNSLRDPVWFEELQEAGFFHVKHSPAVKVISEEKGESFQAEGWPALRYLEHIVPQATGECAERIAAIVREVTESGKTSKLANWRTWWSLAIIFSQLPLEVIQPADIDLVRIWLHGRFDANMVGHEVGQKLLPRLLESSDMANWKKALALVDALTMLRSIEGQS